MTSQVDLTLVKKRKNILRCYVIRRGNQKKAMMNLGVSMSIPLLLCLLFVAIETKEVGEDFPLRESDQEWLNSLFYLPSEPRVRKEYRMLTEEERTQFNDAFVKMKNDRSVIPNKYDLFVSLHARRSTRNSAHRGTGFLGWHRVYTLLMENALREWYPNMTMAYWDTTLDAVLETPRESSLWSEDFMGNGDGYVLKGVFKDWAVQNGELYRTVGAKYGPLADKNITYLLEHDHIGNISFPLRGKNVENVFEEIHNRVHHFVGGEMKVIETAADDPVFFPYHSFVSLIWEDFRAIQRMLGIDPETDWDEYYGQMRHHRFSPMGLGNLMAMDGSSEIFAENIEFADRPFCSRENPDCDSPYLYCNVTVEKCSPWTIVEYDIIKKAGQDNNMLFENAAVRFIESKVNKGYWQLAKLENGTDLEEYGEPSEGYKDLFKIIEEENAKNASNLENGDSQYSEEITNEYKDTSLDFDDGHFHGDHDHGFDDHSHESDDHDHVHNDYDQANNDYDQDHDEHTHDGHTHEGHEHQHGKVIQGGKQIHYIAAIENVFPIHYAVIALAILTGIRLILTILTKCRAENGKKITRSRSKKYRMDGIVNANFSDDENKKSRNSFTNNRRDNIYTVTITTNDPASPDYNSTFVRFEQYAIENTGKESPKPTGTDRQASTVSDYLDMTYASHSSAEGVSASEQTNDMYEKDQDSGDYANDDDDFEDRSFNSIENENFRSEIVVAATDGQKGEDNFDLAAPSDEQKSEDSFDVVAGSNDGQKSENSFDVFDTYDNFVFKREANDVTENTENEKEKSEDSISAKFLPGTHL